MKKFIIPIALLVCATQLCSCASIFCGSKKEITLYSDVDNADKVSISGKNYKNVSFPFNVKISRGFKDSIIEIEKEGYNTETIYVDKKFNGVSILSILCGLVPLGIDAATGAMMKPEYNSYEVDLKPISE